MLRVGGEAHRLDAEVGVEVVAALDHHRGGRGGVQRPAGARPLQADRRREPLAQAEVVHLLAQPPHHVLRRRLPGRDDLAREGPRDQRVHDAHQVAVGGQHLGHAHRKVLEGQVFGPTILTSRGRARLELLPLARRKAVRERVGMRDVRARSWRACGRPGASAGASTGPVPRARGSRPAGRERPCKARRRNRRRARAVDAFVRAPIVEDEDRPPSRREHGRRNEGEQKRISVRYSRQATTRSSSTPVPAHHLGQHPLQAQLQPLLADAVLVTHRRQRRRHGSWTIPAPLPPRRPARGNRLRPMRRAFLQKPSLLSSSSRAVF